MESRPANDVLATRDETSKLLNDIPTTKANVIDDNTQGQPVISSPADQVTIEPQTGAEIKMEEKDETIVKCETIVDDFVMVEPERCEKEIFCRHRLVFLAQLLDRLQLQLAKCNHYQKVFESQDNTILGAKFKAYALLTSKSLETLESKRQDKEWIPSINYEIIKFEGVPFNPEVREKELQLVVRTSDLLKNRTYVVAQFEFPHPTEEHWSRTLSRWFHYSKIDPKNICLCSAGKHQQFDKICIEDIVQLNEPFSPLARYNRPISFFVDRGKSKTLKRKFKQVKLTFYEKQCTFKYDNRIGSVQVKIDEINDESTIVLKLPIMNGRKITKGVAEVTIKVREPLVEKTPKTCEENILTLS